MSTMTLFHSPLSPFVRKVMVVLHETGQLERVQLQPVNISPVSGDPQLNQDNPIGKIPALSTKNMDLFDSPVICEYLDSLHSGTPLFPAKGESRWTALRRHALGVIRMLVEKDLPLDVSALVQSAVPAFGNLITDASAALVDFMFDRLAGSLREQGYSAQEVDAVLALKPQRLGDVAKRLTAVRAFAALPESPALAAANKRIGNILKKADEVDPHVNPALLKESAEQALHEVMQRLLPESEALFNAGDYTASLQTLATLRSPVDAFFDDVMVNAEDAKVRANRYALLAKLRGLFLGVADISVLG